MERQLHLLLLLSLGRSGSTFLAKAISESSDYLNAGENRYFWQELVKKPKSNHPREIEAFFAHKNSQAKYVLDKTPGLYKVLDQVNFGPHHVDYVELLRAPEAIEASRNKFVRILRQPKRLMMRIRKYKKDYGTRWYIPILQRWYFVGSVLGVGHNRAFSTDRGKGGVMQERYCLNAVSARLRETTRVLTINYDDFDQTIGCLVEVGLTAAQIDQIRAAYNK